MSPPVPQQTGLITSIQQAAEDLRATTGQGPASLDELTDTTSGFALRERRKSGDVATFHYTAHISDAWTVMGKILIDMIPKRYGPRSILRILGEDGEAKMVQQDASMDQAHKAFRDAEGHLEHVYNLTVGQYDVVVEAGPSYATKRQEAAAGMKDILQGNPELWAIAGDLFIENLDWPGAHEAARRLKKKIAPPPEDDEFEAEEAEMRAKVEQHQMMVQQGEQQLAQLDQAKQILEAKAQAAQAEVAMQEKELELQAMKAQMGDMQMMAMQGQMDEQKLGALMQGPEMIAGNIAAQVIEQTRRATKRSMTVTPNARNGSYLAQTVGPVKDEQTGLDLQIMARVIDLGDGQFSLEKVKVDEQDNVISRKTGRAVANADGSLQATMLGDE